MRGLVGRDFSARAPRRVPRWLPVAILAVFVASFGLVQLRTEVLRLRYVLGQQLSREQELGARVRALTVEMRRLRAPRELARRAAALGFVRPVQVIDLPPDGPAQAVLPPVAAAGGPKRPAPAPESRP